MNDKPIYILGDNGDQGLSRLCGDSTLNGGAGDDTLKSGPGDDVMFGGEGRDTFMFTGFSGFTRCDGETKAIHQGGDDWIMDFEPGKDTIFLPDEIRSVSQVGEHVRIEHDDGTIWISDIQIADIEGLF